MFLAVAGTEDAAAPSNDQLLLVAVSEIYDGSNFCVNIVSGASGKLADQQKLKEVEEIMKQFSDDVSALLSLHSLTTFFYVFTV